MTRAKDISKIITAPAFGGLTYPTSDGSNGQVIQTNGSGTLSFTTITGTTINNNADNRIITGSGSANTLEAEANLTFDGSTLDLGDNIQARFGASQDMQIFHDGSDSKIVESGTGNLILQSDGTEVRIMNGSEFMGRFQNDGAVKLFHDNSKKFETNSGGITVTGTVSATNLNLTTGDINVTGTGNRAISVLSDDGLGTIEVGGATGGFIDIKQPKTDDFDIRLGSSGTGGYLTIASGQFDVSGGALNHATGIKYKGANLSTVRQIQNVVKSDTFSTNTTSPDGVHITGMQVNITPINSDSRILVTVSLGAVSCSTTASRTSTFQLYRGSTQIAEGNADGSRPRVTFRSWMTSGDTNHALGGLSFTFMDTPGSTATHSYKLHMSGSHDSQTFFLNRSGADSNGGNNYQSRTISTMQAMEIIT